MNYNKCATLYFEITLFPPPHAPHVALFFTSHQGMCSVPFLLSGYCHRLQYQGPLPGPQRSSKVHCSNPLFHCRSVNTQPLSACSSLCGLPLSGQKKKKREGICVMFLKHHFWGGGFTKKCIFDKKGPFSFWLVFLSSPLVILFVSVCS